MTTTVVVVVSCRRAPALLCDVVHETGANAAPVTAKKATNAMICGIIFILVFERWFCLKIGSGQAIIHSFILIQVSDATMRKQTVRHGQEDIDDLVHACMLMLPTDVLTWDASWHRTSWSIFPGALIVRLVRESPRATCNIHIFFRDVSFASFTVVRIEQHVTFAFFEMHLLHLFNFHYRWSCTKWIIHIFQFDLFSPLVWIKLYKNAPNFVLFLV